MNVEICNSQSTQVPTLRVCTAQFACAILRHSIIIHQVSILKILFLLCNVIFYVNGRELCAMSCQLTLTEREKKSTFDPVFCFLLEVKKNDSIILIVIPHAVCFRAEAEFVVCSIMLSSQIVVRLFLSHCANYVTKRH